MKAPLISVIIPCFNYGKYVEDAVASVRIQSYPNVEILVVDGGSDDRATLKVLKKLKADGIRVFLRKGRHLVADNRNFGVQKCKGDFVCCLDADDRMHATFLEKALFVLMSGGLDIVSTSSQQFGEEEMIELVPEYPSVENSMDHNEINTLALVRKNLWLELGGMRDWGIGNRYIFEDWDFWMRCLLAGARVRNIAREPLFFYRKHGNESLSHQSGELQELNQQKETLLDANRTQIEKWNTEGPIRRPEMGGFEGYEHQGSNGEGVVIAPSYSHWVERVSNHSIAGVSGSEMKFILCGQSDIRGRDFVESHACEQGMMVFQLPHFLDAESYNDFVSSFVALHNPTRIEVFDAEKNLYVSVDPEDFNAHSELSTKALSSELEPSMVAMGRESLQIQVLSDSNAFSGSNRVWIAGLKTLDSRGIDGMLSCFASNKGWTKQPCFWSPTGFVFEGRPGSVLDVEIPANSSLLFLGHSHGGTIQVKRNSGIEVVDLYSATQKYVRLGVQLEETGDDSANDNTEPAAVPIDQEWVEVSLQVLEEQNPTSLGTQAWLEDIRLESGESLISQNLKMHQQSSWSFDENEAAPRGYAFLGSPGEPLVLTLPLGSRLCFLTHAWSGILEISIGGHREKVDLYSIDRGAVDYLVRKALRKRVVD